MNVIHRDLKLPNILISNGILKIGDLGFAKRLDDRVLIKNYLLGIISERSFRNFRDYGTRSN